jgi:hypothetical protein
VLPGSLVWAILCFEELTIAKRDAIVEVKGIN